MNTRTVFLVKDLFINKVAVDNKYFNIYKANGNFCANKKMYGNDPPRNNKYNKICEEIIYGF